MPISVAAKARIVLPGAPVTFTGATVADGKRFDVRLTIVKPNAPPAIVATKVDGQGNYTATFADTKQPGRYVVTALAPDALGHEFRVLDDIGGVRDHARYQDLAIGQLHVVPDGVLVLVPRVGGFDEVGLCLHPQDDVDHVGQLQVMGVRPVPAAPAHVIADLFLRDGGKRVVERSTRTRQRRRKASSPIRMPMRSHSAGSQASSTCRIRPEAAMSSYSARNASASA